MYNTCDCRTENPQTEKMCLVAYSSPSRGGSHAIPAPPMATPILISIHTIGYSIEHDRQKHKNIYSKSTKMQQKY